MEAEEVGMEAEKVSIYERKTCRYCQHYKTLNLGRERYCHVWGRKSPMVFDSFYCGWWERKTDTDGA